jgi:hypothetical protein
LTSTKASRKWPEISDESSGEILSEVPLQQQAKAHAAPLPTSPAAGGRPPSVAAPSLEQTRTSSRVKTTAVQQIDDESKRRNMAADYYKTSLTAEESNNAIAKQQGQPQLFNPQQGGVNWTLLVEMMHVYFFFKLVCIASTITSDKDTS